MGIKKEGAINSAVIIFLVFIILIFGVTGAIYLSSKEVSESSQESLSAKDVIRGIGETILQKLHIQAKNIGKVADSLDPKLNISFDTATEGCKFKQGFTCEDVRVDWGGNRLWFKLKSKLQRVIIKEIRTEGPVTCLPLRPNNILELDNEYSFILEECTLVKLETSQIIIQYYFPTSSPELFRIAEGTFTLGGS